jgi:Zn-dependent protease with chaperone function
MSAFQQYLAAPGGLLFLLNVGLASCLVCALGLACVRLCRRHSAPLRHGVLLVALVLLVLSPLVAALGGAYGLGGVRIPLGGPAMEAAKSGLVARRPITEVGPESDAALSDVPAEAAGVESGTGKLLAAMQISGTLLALAWGVGSAVMVGRFARGLWLVARLRQTLRAAHEPALDRTVAEACRAMGMRCLEVCETRLALAPFSMGLVRPVIVLPEGLARELEEEQLRYVLVHEAAHIKRRDPWVALLQPSVRPCSGGTPCCAPSMRGWSGCANRFATIT